MIRLTFLLFLFVEASCFSQVVTYDLSLARLLLHPTQDTSELQFKKLQFEDFKMNDTRLKLSKMTMLDRLSLGVPIDDSIKQDVVDLKEFRVAQSALEIKSWHQIKGDTIFYSIGAVFRPGTSFISAKEEITLRHEQIHFDITELFARRIKRHLTILQKNDNMYSTVDRIINDYKERSLATGSKFDTEWKHAVMDEEVLAFLERYEKDLSRMLDNLREYAPVKGYIVVDKW